MPHHDRERGSAASRGYDRTWQKVRLQVLAAEPLCRFCMEQGRITPAREVDHIQTIRDRPELRLVLSNLRPLCTPCHAAHTGRRGGEDRHGGCDEAGRPIDPGHPWNRARG